MPGNEASAAAQVQTQEEEANINKMHGILLRHHLV
jgi:hypothetical protein